MQGLDPFLVFYGGDDKLNRTYSERPQMRYADALRVRWLPAFLYRACIEIGSK